MNNVNKNAKKLILVVVLGVGIICIKAELSKQQTFDQLLKCDTPVCFDGLEVFSKSFEVQEKKRNLETQFREEGKNLEKLRAEAEKSAAELQNMGSIATELARRTKQEEALEKQNRVKVKETSLQQYAQDEMQRAEYEMAQKLRDYAIKVAKEEGYRMVLAGGVAYAEDDLNISSKIVARWNNEYDAAKKMKTI